jgi:hypothetical protein
MRSPAVARLFSDQDELLLTYNVGRKRSELRVLSDSNARTVFQTTQVILGDERLGRFVPLKIATELVPQGIDNQVLRGGIRRRRRIGFSRNDCKSSRTIARTFSRVSGEFSAIFRQTQESSHSLVNYRTIE